MQAHARSLAAVLALATFIIDVGGRSALAFDCPRPRFLSEDMTNEEFRVRAHELAEKEANNAHLIFFGRVRSIRHVGTSSDRGYPAYLVTYSVAEWFKGKVGDQVRLIRVPAWCDGGCDIKGEIASALKQGDSDKMVVAGRTDWLKEDKKLRPLAGKAHGAGGDGVCGPYTLKSYSRPTYLDGLPSDSSVHRAEERRRLLAEAGATKLEELRRNRVQDAP